MAEQGKTPLFFCREHSLLGIIAVADVIKEDSPKAIKELQNMGIRVVMLTGDRKAVAEQVAREVGITDFKAELLPQDKVAAVEELLSDSRGLAFVGDGINDAPVLSRADIGIAMGALGSDAAIEAADIVLMDDDLTIVNFEGTLTEETKKKDKKFMKVSI